MGGFGKITRNSNKGNINDNDRYLLSNVTDNDHSGTVITTDH